MGRQVPPKRILKRAGHSFRVDIAKQIDTEGFCPIRGEPHAGTGRWRGNDAAATRYIRFAPRTP